MKSYLTVISALALVFLFLNIAYSAPQLSGVTVQEHSLSITGFNFGTKIPASPILWDDFEGGTLGDTLQSAGLWQKWGSNPGAQFSATHSYSGSKAGYNQIAGTSAVGPNMGGFNTNYYSFSGVDELYYSYRYRIEVNDISNIDSMRAVIKAGRMGNECCDPYHGPGGFYVAGHPIKSGGTQTYYNAGEGGVNLGWSGHNMYGMWHRHEMYKKLSTPGQNDGSLFLIYNHTNVQKQEKNLLTRATGYSFQSETVLLPLMGVGYGNNPTTDLSFFVDDVYVDNTLARVEIGDHPDFWSVSNREIQIPVEWSDSEIKVTINMGKFTDINQLYLYVVDADGNPSAGFGPLGSLTIQPPPGLKLIGN